MSGLKLALFPPRCVKKPRRSPTMPTFFVPDDECRDQDLRAEKIAASYFHKSWVVRLYGFIALSVSVRRRLHLRRSASQRLLCGNGHDSCTASLYFAIHSPAVCPIRRIIHPIRWACGDFFGEVLASGVLTGLQYGKRVAALAPFDEGTVGVCLF